MKLYPLPPAATSSLELGLRARLLATDATLQTLRAERDMRKRDPPSRKSAIEPLTYYVSPALPFSSPFRRSRSESITVEATIYPVFVNVVAVGLCTMKTIAVVESLLAIMRAFADFVALVRLPVFTRDWLETPQLY
ncbi:hypothetical protein H9P43_009632 [Blastocladiella emersonii ATCC 22665]|nr:hypothetical protein H9P43_009632 [Blastocladiella emersonii ATCC 22665]